MYKLYHFPLCPFSRKLRILMGEKKLNFDLIHRDFWRKDIAFFKLTPFAAVPVLAIDGGGAICHSMLAAEYIDAQHKGYNFIPYDFKDSLAVKTMALWFDEKFFNDVVYHFLYQKVINVVSSAVPPNTAIMQAAKNNMFGYFDYMESLFVKTKYIAGDHLSLADISAAAHLSVLDYLSVIDWSRVQPAIKDWYSIIKCRASFRPLLSDRVPSFNPPPHYQNLDF